MHRCRREAGLVVRWAHGATYSKLARRWPGECAAPLTSQCHAPFSPSDPGVIGAVLTTPEVNAELIADACTLRSRMKLLLLAKGARTYLGERWSFGNGHADGKYMLAE